MAFYNVPYKDILEANISSDAKILYLYLESWYNYCKSKGKDCSVYHSQICKALNMEINQICNACYQLGERGFMRSWPERDKVEIGMMITIDKENTL